MKVYLNDGALDMSEVVAITQEKDKIKVLFKSGGYVYFDDRFNALDFLKDRFEECDD